MLIELSKRILSSATSLTVAILHASNHASQRLDELLQLLELVGVQLVIWRCTVHHHPCWTHLTATCHTRNSLRTK